MNWTKYAPLLKKLTGKVDDVAEEAVEQLSPEQIAILRNASKEAADMPTNLVGTGKNLDALNRAKEDISVMGKLEAPAYPKGVNQDDLGNVGDFKLVGGPQSKDFSMVPGGSQVPALRGNTMPLAGEVVEEASENMLPVVRGNTLPKGDIVDAEVLTKPGFGKKAAIGAATVAGGAGLAHMMTKDKESEARDPMTAAALINAAPESLDNFRSSSDTSTPKPADVAAPKQMDDANVEQAPAQEADYVRMLREAQSRQGELDLIDNMLRAGTTIGSGIAGVKADYSGVDALQKQNTKGVEDVKTLMKGDMDDKKLKAVQTELNDAKALRDPNSDVSKAFRTALDKLGIPYSPKTTAADAKAMGINIQNLLTHEKTLQSNERMAKIKAENKGKFDPKEVQKLTQSFRKEATSGENGKLFNVYSTAARSSKLIEEFAKNPSGYKDYATLMNSLKTLQGDSSVVRETEIRLGMNATSMANKALNHLQQAANGKALQPSQRKEIIEATQVLSKVGRDVYMDAVKPILSQADEIGIDHKFILGAGLSDDKKEAGVSPSGSYTPNQEKAIELVMQKNNVDRNTAINALKKAKKL